MFQFALHYHFITDAIRDGVGKDVSTPLKPLPQSTSYIQNNSATISLSTLLLQNSYIQNIVTASIGSVSLAQQVIGTMLRPKKNYQWRLFIEFLYAQYKAAKESLEQNGIIVNSVSFDSIDEEQLLKIYYMNT